MAGSRVSQTPVEVILTPDPSVRNARLSQSAVEVVIAPQTQKARASQAVIEVIYSTPRAGAGFRGYIIG